MISLISLIILSVKLYVSAAVNVATEANRVPLYPIFPSNTEVYPYVYPENVPIFVINEMDSDSVIERISSLLTLFEPIDMHYQNMKQLFVPSAEIYRNLLAAFTESYPSFLNVAISVIDFWFLTLFAIAMAPSHIHISRFFNKSGDKALELIIGALFYEQGSVSFRFYESDSFVRLEKNLRMWPYYMIRNGYKRSAFRSFEVLFYWYSESTAHTFASPGQLSTGRTFPSPAQLETFRNLIANSGDLTLSGIISFDYFNPPNQIVFRILDYLKKMPVTCITQDCVKILVDTISMNNEYLPVYSVISSAQFKNQFKNSPNVSNSFSSYFPSTLKSDDSSNFRAFLKFLYVIYEGEDEQINFLYDAFVLVNAVNLMATIYFDASIPCKQSIISKSFDNLISTLRTASSPFASAIIFFTLNFDIYDNYVSALLDNPNLNHCDLIIMALQSNASPGVTDLVFKHRRFDFMRPPPSFSHYTENSKKWILIRELLRSNTKLRIANSILYSQYTDPVNLIFLSDDLGGSIYYDWVFKKREYWNWELTKANVNQIRVETRIGNYPNSYQLVDSTDPIFSSVYPLSLALIIGNKTAIRYIFCKKHRLSMSHLRQADKIAAMGFSTDYFNEIKSESANKCIIS